MRLIDADELLKRVDEERKYLIARGQTGAEHILVHNFRDLIDNAPTINLAVPINMKPLTAEEKETLIKGFTRNGLTTFELYDERPKGEWIKEKSIMYCSNCQSRPAKSEYGYDVATNFCPQCGADMRKGGKEE